MVGIFVAVTISDTSGSVIHEFSVSSTKFVSVTPSTGDIIVSSFVWFFGGVVVLLQEEINKRLKIMMVTRMTRVDIFVPFVVDNVRITIKTVSHITLTFLSSYKLSDEQTTFNSTFWIYA